MRLCWFALLVHSRVTLLLNLFPVFRHLGKRFGSHHLVFSPVLSRTRSSTHSRILLSFGFRSRCFHTFVQLDVLIAFRSQPSSSIWIKLPSIPIAYVRLPSLNDCLILGLLEVDPDLIVVWTLLHCHLPHLI